MLPSASSKTSVGWKSWLLETRKSLSLVLNEGISPYELRMLEESGRQDHLTARGEIHVDRIVHAACHHRLDERISRPAAKNVRCARHEGRLAGSFVGLFRKCAFAPVDPSV